MRGIADDVPLKPWLTQHIWPREGRFVSSDFVYDGTLLAAAEMLRGGVTCCNDMYFYPDAAARAYEDSGHARADRRCPSSTSRRRTPPTPTPIWRAGSPRAMPSSTYRRSPFALAPHAPYTVGDATFAKDRHVTRGSST